MPSAIIEGDLSAKGLRFAIIVGRFNSFVTDRLLAGALDALTRSGCPQENIEIVKVPGSWEMPVVARELAQAKRGDTPHFDYVAGAMARGLAQVAMESGIPVGFGVLTTNTVEQAVDRAGAKGGNKGFDAAMSAIEMANLMRRLRQPSA
ncbi:MAG: 6,7-dimethyl-8-ribityllumazine synthase [Acidobacteria bacterium]|nr:MAG: 6,7-dimethyl-8-ribityllumazine synthase [Acidobacteriota bacterium]